MALVDLKTNLADWSGLKKPSDANPAAVNFFDAGGVNSTTGARGFTKNADNANQSDFLGISSNNQQYTYPAQVRGNRLMKPSATVTQFPGPQNFINDANSGARGFTLGMNSTRFLGIANPNQTGQVFNYPSSVQNRRLMQPAGAVLFPGPQNFINDVNSGHVGFQLNADNVNQSNFIGISGQTYTYPNLVRGGRLMAPLQSTIFPGPQNFINDQQSGAKGFTLGMNSTQFLGVSSNGQSYTYPTSVLNGRLMQPLNSSAFPGPQNFIRDIPSGARGFTLGMNSTRFINANTVAGTYTYPTSVLSGRLMQPLGSSVFPGPQNFINDQQSGANGFRLNANNVNQSNFIGISGQSYTYPTSVLNGRLMQPLNSSAFPGPQNFINNSAAGANGFTLGMNSTQFLGVSSNGQQYTYPQSVLGGRLMQPVGSLTLVTNFPGPQNFINNNLSGASGFRLNAGDTPNQSDFLGISGQTYTYPQTVRNGRLMRPSLSTIAFPGPQNFFNDQESGVNGFTLRMADQPGTEKSKFIGISNNSYTAPATNPAANTVFVLPLTSATGPTGWNQALAVLNNQLGLGSRFYYKTANGLQSKIFSKEGYSVGNKYSDKVKGGKDANNSEQSLLYKKSTEKNSPSALEEQYSLFNLQDDSYNPYGYLPQPFILRGIQRKSNKKPQYWGVSPLLDDGLIRGGSTAALEIGTIDLVRLGQWAATPKGLLWVGKQVGLGLTNPQMETVNPANIVSPTPIGISQNRIHTGLQSLLSVPTTAFGLHFTRHGIPFVNYLTDYERVQNQLKKIYEIHEESNRLVKLKSQLIGTPILGPEASSALNNVSAFFGIPIPTPLAIPTIPKGITIPALSYLGGPNSAYGIGVTNIKRSEDTVSDALTNAARSNFKLKYDLNNSYGLAKFDELTDDNGQTKLLNYKNPLTQLTATYFNIANRNEKNLDDVERASNTVRQALDQAAKPNPETNESGFKPIYDIRKRLEDVDDKKLKDYLHTTYGFARSRKKTTTSADLDPKKFIVPGKDFSGNSPYQLYSDPEHRGDKINAIDFIDQYKTSPYPDNGPKDFIKFYFEDAAANTNAMVFRCTINGFSDTFTPNWSNIEILGRPEGAYLYSSFERQISFNFTVAAQSRSEMIPIWRKLNYLATYTMPTYASNQAVKPSGPFMRITLGDLFYQTPGFINSLSYTVPDEATWDIGQYNSEDTDAKQLPTIVDVAVGFTLITDYRPQLKGRAYSLSPGGISAAGTNGQWLADSIFAQ